MKPHGDYITVPLSAKDIAQGTTMLIRVPKLGQWKWRIKVGEWLMHLAAWIMWINFEVEETGEINRNDHP